MRIHGIMIFESRLQHFYEPEMTSIGWDVIELIVETIMFLISGETKDGTPLAECR
jgi:hypothetical protein